MSNKLSEIFKIEFISSSQITEQYKAAKRLFRSRMKRLFPEDEIIIGSCPHFEFTGFIKRSGRYVYFSTGDLRWKLMNSMLVRTAKHDKDWTGGSNNFVQYNDDFDEKFKQMVDYLFERQEKLSVTLVEVE